MKSGERPHCEKPDACEAKGAGHCRRCAGRASMAQHRADPAFVERLRAAGRNLSSAGRAALVERMRCLNEDHAQQAARVERGRLAVARYSADPEIVRIRTERYARTRAARLAKSIRIPLEHVPEYRRLRRIRLTKEEAIGVLARSYPASFRAYQQAEVAKQRRVIDWRSGTIRAAA